MEADVILGQIRAKNEEIFQAEDDYRAQMNRLDNHVTEVGYRREALVSAISKESDAMLYFLHRLELSYQDAGQYFSQLEYLQGEGDWGLRKELAEADEQENQAKKAYNKRVDNLEEELFKLRRQYDDLFS